MLFAETREHLFPCLLVKRKGDCRVLLHKSCKTCGNLFFLTLFRHLNSHRKARLREIDSGELEYVFRVTERVARLTPAIFVTTPISPAMIAGASSCFAPFTNTILPIFSISPVRKLYAAVSGASLPETTLKNDILPTNGSAIVLKQTAASGPFSSQGKIPSSPFSYVHFSPA